MAPRGPHEAQPPEKSRPHLRNDEVQTPCCDRSIDRSIPGILNDTGDDDGTRRNHHTARVVGFFQSHEGHDGEVAGRAPNHRLAERARAGLPAESSDTTGGRRDVDVDVDVDVDRFRLGRYGDLQAAADDVLAGRHSARHSHVPGASLSELLPELLSESLPLSLLLGYRRAMPTARSLGGLRRSFLSLSLSLFQDAAYSGDWSRIGVISTETERFLQTFCLFGVAIHALLGVAAAKISMDRGERNWWVRGLKTVRCWEERSRET